MLAAAFLSSVIGAVYRSGNDSVAEGSWWIQVLSMAAFIAWLPFRLANSREPQNLIWGKGDTLASDYDAFVKAGGRVLLCPHCSEHAGVTEKDLRPGARIGKTGELAKTILAAEKVLDY